MKRFFGIFLTIFICVEIIVTLNSCESYNREIKSISSDISGGLNRTLVVLDYQGDTIAKYEGRFDIRDEGADNQVFFDLNGKRIWIQGGIVISEEK